MNNNTPTTLNDRMNALKNRATQQQGEIWQPQAGETLVGVIAGSEAVAHPLYGNQVKDLGCWLGVDYWSCRNIEWQLTCERDHFEGARRVNARCVEVGRRQGPVRCKWCGGVRPSLNRKDRNGTSQEPPCCHRFDSVIKNTSFTAVAVGKSAATVVFLHK